MDKDAEGREGLLQPAAQGIDNTHLGGIMTGVHQGQPRLPGGQPFVVLHLAGDKGIHGGVQLHPFAAPSAAAQADEPHWTVTAGPYRRSKPAGDQAGEIPSLHSGGQSADTT